MPHSETLMIEHRVRELIAKKALHKKKQIRMSEETWGKLIDHLWEEINEFEEAEQLDGKDETRTDRMREELGDILGLVVHAIIKAGFTFHEVEQQELKKLKERFLE